VNSVESEEYKELKAEIEAIKKHVAKLEKELLNVKRLAQEALDAAAML
jgi:cell division protein FtsB